jgi:hypothetical protein
MRLIAVLSLVVLASHGCAPAGPKTHPVRGKVELAGAESVTLAGSHVEAALATDPTVRASGEILPDGRFALQTLHAGNVLKGAPAGRYQVRIVPSDDDRRARKAVALRFQQFGTSGLTLDVPASGEVTLRVASR